MEGLGITGASDECPDGKDAIVVDRRPVRLCIGVRLKLPEEAPERQQDFYLTTRRGQDLLAPTALTAWREMQLELDFFLDRHEVHEVAVRLQMPPDV